VPNDVCVPHVYVPHIDLVLQSLRINRERLASKAKIAIDARLLRAILQALIAHAPFSESFYKTTYPDVAEAHEAGQIPDLHKHFIESGFFEGRLGASPDVDEDFYASTYRDVGRAVENGDVRSGADHYLRSGAAEGRVPNPAAQSSVDDWMQVLRDDGRRG
jgi:hypothetical protein